jgi:hypothetical protein
MAAPPFLQTPTEATSAKSVFGAPFFPIPRSYYVRKVPSISAIFCGGPHLVHDLKTSEHPRQSG